MSEPWYQDGVRFRCTATVLLAAVVGAGYLVVPVQKPRITKASYDKIELGWPLERVEQLLGKRVYTPDSWWDIWQEEDGNTIFVHFHITSSGAAVTDKVFKPRELSLLERVKDRIERRIRAIWPGQRGIPYSAAIRALP